MFVGFALDSDSLVLDYTLQSGWIYDRSFCAYIYFLLLKWRACLCVHEKSEIEKLLLNVFDITLKKFTFLC